MRSSDLIVFLHKTLFSVKYIYNKGLARSFGTASVFGGRLYPLSNDDRNVPFEKAGNILASVIYILRRLLCVIFVRIWQMRCATNT